MKRNQKIILALITAGSLFIYSCGGPNDNQGGMDSKNSDKEGGIDSTKIPNFDSAHAGDSAHAAIERKKISVKTIQFNPAGEKVAFSGKSKKGLFLN